MSRIKTHRRQAFLEQSGRCFYCSAEMWLTHPERFASRHGLSEREAWRFKCTAEHLVARCDGGPDSQANLVAACQFCNSTRHRFRCAPEPPAYVQHVQRRVRAGRWHPSKYRHLVVGDAAPGRPLVEAG
jgi:5-methylcytosine-specific restriction endonuclease McrA